MDLHAIETASRQAWPALHEQELPYGVLRFARGVSRRANSLSLFVGARPDWAQLCAMTEEFFCRHQQPAIVRVLSTSITDDDDGLDRFLTRRGYRMETPTGVMTCALGAVRAGIGPEANSDIQEVPLELWLDAWHGMLGKSPHELEVHQLMLSRLRHQHHLLVQYDRVGQPLCCGMAVTIGELMGVFGVATAPTCRNRGFARNLVKRLLERGVTEGAKHAYLQVEKSNLPAIAAYEWLGFREEYSYWYRELNLENNKVRGER